MAATTKHNLPSTIFFIDDDPAVLRRVTKDSLRETNLGVLTAEDLPMAVKFLEEDFPIGAILADLNFRPVTHDKKHQIHDGLDFLHFATQGKPNLPIYVLSIDANDRAIRHKADRMGLNIKGWYDKLSPQQGQFSPWARIERDLILQALKSEPSFRAEASKTGEDPVELLTDEHVAERVRSIFNYPRLTYMQYLPKGSNFRLKEPIAVHCWPSGNRFAAKAVFIPLLVEAEGEDPVEALENLSELLIKEKVVMDSEDEAHVSGYARYIKEQLSGYIETDPNLEPEDATT